MSTMSSEELIQFFDKALEDKWGYIWGTAGIEWTAARQKQKVDYMVNKYGTSWQKNSEAKDDTYYRAALIGEKWIGHRVADCSGLFKRAFEEKKIYIAHGSNTIFLQYCKAKGRLVNGRRQDGQSLKPGTAVFVYDKTRDNYKHIGLYVGGSRVIEAQGTDAGVCTSNIGASKWTHWGELKNVAYDGDTGFPDKSTWHATVRRGSKGEDVRYVQTMLYNLGYNIGKWGIDGDFGKDTEAAVKEFQRDNRLTQDGVVGPLTYAALEKATEKPVTDKRYTVCVKGLTKAQADDIKAKYPNCTVSEE